METERKTIEVYLREKIEQYINRKYIAKDHCEKCGSNENLESHHDEIYFSYMLLESLKILNLEYRDFVDEYSKEDLKHLKYLVLGMDITHKRMTLCQSCHIKIHIMNDTLLRHPVLFKKTFSKQIEYMGNFGITDLKIIKESFNYYYLKEICDKNKDRFLEPKELFDIIINFCDNSIPEKEITFFDEFSKFNFSYIFFECLLKYFGLNYIIRTTNLKTGDVGHQRKIERGYKIIFYSWRKNVVPFKFAFDNYLKNASIRNSNSSIGRRKILPPIILPF